VIDQRSVRVGRSLDQLVDGTGRFEPALLGFQVATHVANEM
jgi:hypothetical protein